MTKKEIESANSKRVSSHHLKTTIRNSGLRPKRLGVRIRKFPNLLLIFNLNFISALQKRT